MMNNFGISGLTFSTSLLQFATPTDIVYLYTWPDWVLLIF